MIFNCKSDSPKLKNFMKEGYINPITRKYEKWVNALPSELRAQIHNLQEMNSNAYLINKKQLKEQLI